MIENEVIAQNHAFLEARSKMTQNGMYITQHVCYTVLKVMIVVMHFDNFE